VVNPSKVLGIGLNYADHARESGVREGDTTQADYEAELAVVIAGTPTEVAKAALYVASDDAAFMTGEALVIDGGLTAGV
jgi:2-keto-4-pentenoate hydratase/2-oxohepta-3-ene-1,7-dioic acid hydratase in catechol pathway